MSSPSPLTTTFIRVAIVAGAAITALLILWLMEIVPFPVFIGGLVAVAAVESLVILSAVRRVQRAAGPAQGGSTVAPSSTAHGTEAYGTTASTTAYGAVGYDPMDGLPGTERRDDGR
ncbi:hypothetical protein [Georgenia sunbinii]|uniref:hypothetical protein n=1 Tax=Georgenia sunbinii TaxID=3117728 RepID=UPI002F260D0D